MVPEGARVAPRRAVVRGAACPNHERNPEGATMSRRGFDHTGHRYGRLLVLELDVPDKHGNARWRCQCACGATALVHGTALRSGRSRSCGCLAREQTVARNVTHGLKGHPLYVVWKSIITRCTNPNSRNWHNYGGRGISIDPTWRHDAAAFVEHALSVGWRPGLEIDRIDNDRGYSPGNIRAVTPRVNTWNTRRSAARSLPPCIYEHKGRFVVRIRIEGRPRQIGRFLDLDSALRARDKALEFDQRRAAV